MASKAPRTVTFTTSPANPSHEPQQVTGTPARVLGVSVVVHHNKVSQWQVCEPTTGRSIVKGCTSKASALRRAVERCDLFGGRGALLHNMAHTDRSSAPLAVTGWARPSSNRLHSPELAYLAGGPLDAPEHLPAGSTVAASYTHIPEGVTVRRAGWFA